MKIERRVKKIALSPGVVYLWNSLLQAAVTASVLNASKRGLDRNLFSDVGVAGLEPLHVVTPRSPMVSPRRRDKGSRGGCLGLPHPRNGPIRLVFCFNN